MNCKLDKILKKSNVLPKMATKRHKTDDVLILSLS